MSNIKILNHTDSKIAKLFEFVASESIGRTEKSVCYDRAALLTNKMFFWDRQSQ